MPNEFRTHRTSCLCVKLSCWTPSPSSLHWQTGLWQDHPSPAPQVGQASSLLCRAKSIAAVGAHEILSPSWWSSTRAPSTCGWLRNEHTDCYLKALHCFAITTEQRVGSPKTQMAQSWGGLLAWRRTGLVFNMFYFKFGMQGGKNNAFQWGQRQDTSCRLLCTYGASDTCPGLQDSKVSEGHQFWISLWMSQHV